MLRLRETMLPAIAATKTYIEPGKSFSFASGGGANEAIVDVKSFSADMKRSMPLLTDSSACVAYLYSSNLVRLTCSAKRSVGEGRRGALAVAGLSVMPDAGGGVEAAISRIEGSEGVSYIGFRLRCDNVSVNSHDVVVCAYTDKFCRRCFCFCISCTSDEHASSQTAQRQHMLFESISDLSCSRLSRLILPVAGC